MNADPSPAEARAALDALGADRAELAERVVTPWWYHPALGVAVAMLVGSQGLPGAWSSILVALAIIGIVLVALVYRRQYGVVVTEPAGPASRRILFLLVGVLVAAMLAALVIRLTGSPLWWVLAPTVLVAVVTVLLGRHYDAVYRRELAQS